MYVPVIGEQFKHANKTFILTRIKHAERFSYGVFFFFIRVVSIFFTFFLTWTTSFHISFLQYTHSILFLIRRTNENHRSRVYLFILFFYTHNRLWIICVYRAIINPFLVIPTLVSSQTHSSGLSFFLFCQCAWGSLRVSCEWVTGQWVTLSRFCFFLVRPFLVQFSSFSSCQGLPV